MEFTEYQKRTSDTVLPESDNLIYAAVGLPNEVGELLGLVKKYIRGDFGIDTLRTKVQDEGGDVLWYLNQIFKHLSIDADEVANQNLEKLSGRKERGTLHGDGER